jgi:hypothetical protein
VEGRERGLEREARRGEADADEHEGVVGQRADPVADRRKVSRSAGAVDEREPVEQRRRPQRADDQVLEPRLERLLAAERRSAQHVERDREQLERDEQGDEVLRLGE